MRYWELNEAFDKPPAYTITRDNQALLELRATIGDRDIIFHARAQGSIKGKDMWEIEFTEEGLTPDGILYATSGKSGSGNEFQVFALVMEGINLLIQKRNPGIIRFSAMKQGNRERLYSKIVKRMLPPGWEAHESPTSEKTKFWLEKKDLKEGISYTLIPGEKFYRELFPQGDIDDHYLFDLVQNQVQESQSILELFDSNPSMKVISKNDREFTVRSEIEGRDIEFTAQKEGYSEIWETTFYAFKEPGRPTFQLTGKGNGTKVFSFVIKAFDIFIETYEPQEIYFTASKSDESRESTYSMLLQRYLPPDYELELVNKSAAYVKFVLRRKTHP